MQGLHGRGGNERNLKVIQCHSAVVQCIYSAYIVYNIFSTLPHNLPQMYPDVPPKTPADIRKGIHEILQHTMSTIFIYLIHVDLC